LIEGKYRFRFAIQHEKTTCFYTGDYQIKERTGMVPVTSNFYNKSRSAIIFSRMKRRTKIVSVITDNFLVTVGG
jgi:hypothetical protein